MLTSLVQRAPSITHALLRIMTGFLFLQHGAPKLLGTLPGSALPPDDPVALFTLLGVSGVLETFGGAAIMLGLCTRPVAFLLSGEMAVAYFLGHAQRSFWPVENRGELAALYAFVFLYFAVHGGGRFALGGAKP